MRPMVPATLKRPRPVPRLFIPREMRPMPAGWLMQQKAPMTASDHRMPDGVVERAVRKDPAAQPKNPMIRASRLLV